MKFPNAKNLLKVLFVLQQTKSKLMLLSSVNGVDEIFTQVDHLLRLRHNVQYARRHVYCSHAVCFVMIAHVFKQLLSWYATTRYTDYVYSKTEKSTSL